MSNKLKEITYLTVKDLKKQEIILPGTYSNTFEKFAKNMKIDIDKKDMFLNDLKQDEEHVDKIVKKTNESLHTLKESTSDAQKAIVARDDKSLDVINTRLSKMEAQIEFLQKQLYSDPLTGAYNRKWFSEIYLNNDNFKNDGFISFLDLNRFKVINDNYGHIVGDQVLKYLVKFLNNEFNVSGIDIVRYAGDEFLILFDKSKISILNVEDKVIDAQKKLSRQKLKSAKIDELQFSFSYGLSAFKKGDNMEEILDKVDELMYQNKEACR